MTEMEIPTDRFAAPLAPKAKPPPQGPTQYEKILRVAADLFDARRMYDLGFINEMAASDDEVLSRAEAVATRIAGNAPLTISTTKEALRRIVRGTTGDDHDLVERCYLSEDFKEGMSAFLEKRKPNWDRRYVEIFGRTIEDVYEEGMKSLESKLKAAGA